MNNVNTLQAVTEFSAEDLGKQVFALVSDEGTRSTLLERHFVGVVARHSKSKEDSVESMERAQRIHYTGAMAIFAVVASSGDAVGMATADPALKLRRIRNLPIIRRLPPATVNWPLAQTLRGYSPNVAAWTSEPLISRMRPKLLEESYRELAQPSGPAYEMFAGNVRQLGLTERMFATRRFNPWTIETGFHNSPVHMALDRAGLEYREDGWFDDNEDRHHAVPHTTLYSLKDPRTVPS